MKTKEQAIGAIVRAWGVSGETKVEATMFVLNGADPDKVCKAVEEIESGLGALENMRPGR